MSLGERHDFHDHDQANDFVGEQCADPGCMRANQVLLQVLKFVVADSHLCQLAEPGVDAVNLFAARDDGIDVGMRGFYERTRFLAKAYFAGCLSHLSKIIERDRGAVEQYFH